MSTSEEAPASTEATQAPANAEPQKKGRSDEILSAVYHYLLFKARDEKDVSDNPYMTTAAAMQKQFPEIKAGEVTQPVLMELWSKRERSLSSSKQPASAKRKDPPPSSDGLPPHDSSASKKPKQISIEANTSGASKSDKNGKDAPFSSSNPPEKEHPTTSAGNPTCTTVTRDNTTDAAAGTINSTTTENSAAAAAAAEGTTDASKTTPRQKGTPYLPWKTRYEHLIEYKKRFGHTRVPRKWKEDPSLGIWIHTQRGDYRNKQLSAERIELLEKLGFEWLVHTGKIPSWEDRLEECKKFHQEHGHLKIPAPVKDKAPDNKLVDSFQRWAEQLRADKRKFDLGFETKLTEERIEELDKLGFDWGAKPALPAKGARVPWDFRFRELEEYKQRHGDCRVPKVFKENEALGTWVSTQRRLFSKGTLQQDRLKRLQDIGFCWNTGWTDKCTLPKVE